MHSKRYHVIIDMTGLPDGLIVDEVRIREFLNTLPAVIGMSILNPPIVVKGIPENPGLTGFVIIDYSHISVHTFSKYNEALIDVFSCKPYDRDKMESFVLDFFGSEKDSSSIKVVDWA